MAAQLVDWTAQTKAGQMAVRSVAYSVEQRVGWRADSKVDCWVVLLDLQRAATRVGRSVGTMAACSAGRTAAYWVVPLVERRAALRAARKADSTAVL